MKTDEELKTEIIYQIQSDKMNIGDILNIIIKKSRENFTSNEEIKADLAEILNNLEDDLNEEGVKQGKNLVIVKAIRKYTYKVVFRKYKKYGGKENENP